MVTLKLSKFDGLWEMDITKEENNKFNILWCIKCKKNIENEQFFFCKEMGRGICLECELKNPGRVCKSIKDEHEHFRIERLKVLKKDGDNEK